MEQTISDTAFSKSADSRQFLTYAEKAELIRKDYIESINLYGSTGSSASSKERGFASVTDRTLLF